ncbi:unnamed protein product [Prorocentrum cordatum]|uniref:CASP-like protein n=1 Tax=Prorocentrum cordatum TaxID=2364126 RepID=A0ABN9TH99_9DINO|nr:unnamed protein product [Polarella glacialis]
MAPHPPGLCPIMIGDPALLFGGWGHRLARLSLRFPSGRTELAFVEARAGKALRACALAAAVLALLAAIAVYQDDGRSCEEGVDPAAWTVYWMKIASILDI